MEVNDMNVIKKILAVTMKLFRVVSIILLIITLFLVVHDVIKYHDANECQGTIVDFYGKSVENISDNDDGESISPVVLYEVNGKKYKLIAHYYSSNMEIGQQVDVLYDEDNHAKATLKAGLYFTPLLTGGMSLFFGLLAALYSFMKRKGISILGNENA